EITKTITLNLTDDLLDESNESVTVTLSNPHGSDVAPAIGTAAASTTIIDNDAPTSISIAADQVSVNEDAGTITFTVTRTGDAQGTQTVDYALSGTAGARDVSDARFPCTTLFRSEITKTITLNLTDDLLD